MSVCLQVNALGTESVRLQGIHMDQGDQIHGKQEEMEQNWEQLRNKVSATHISCFIGSTSVPPTIHASSAPLQGNPLDIRFVEFDQLPHLFIGSDCHPFCWFSSQNSQLEKFHSRHGIDL